MLTYRYANEINTVVFPIKEDGTVEMCVLASDLPEGTIIERYVPPIVTRFKARAAMAQAGYFTQVDDFMSALPKTDIRRMAWEDATEFDRTSTTLKSMAEMLGLTETDLDNLFILAAGIEA